MTMAAIKETERIMRKVYYEDFDPDGNHSPKY